MRARKLLASGFFVAAVAVAFVPDASAWSHRRGERFVRANGPTELGPWVQEGWDREDWARAPSVRGWGYSAPADYGPYAGYLWSDEWYPWGFTTPYVRVGRQCVSSEMNVSVGGAAVRYQRVRPSYYCN
jgi:hypothetical protein